MRRTEHILSFAESLLQAPKYRTDFQTIQLFCLFIGYPRSGHSLVGALLDAHPNIVIAHEQDVGILVEKGFSQSQIEYLLLKNSRSQAESGRMQTAYSYTVPDQWQGRYQQLAIIGDKKGGGTTERLQKNPDLLNQLQHVIQKPLKFVHVIRNPFDNISSIYRRDCQAQQRDLPTCIRYYFDLVKTVESVRQRIAVDAMLTIRYEWFIDDTAAALKSLCGFLRQPVTSDYLESCAKIVFESPHKNRYKVDWSPELIEHVQQQIDSFDMLHGYTYNS